MMPLLEERLPLLMRLSLKPHLKHRPSVAAVGVSPGKAVELHMKNFEQLRYLQQLYEDSILTTEFEEQKEQKNIKYQKIKLSKND